MRNPVTVTVQVQRKVLVPTVFGSNPNNDDEKKNKQQIIQQATPSTLENW